MRRRHRWVWGLVGFLVVLVTIEYIALAWVVPRYAVRIIRDTVGEAVTIGQTHLRFPFTLVLTDVRLGKEWPLAGFHARRVILTPSWLPWRGKTVSLRAIEIEEPWVRFSRTGEGTLLWPEISIQPTIPLAVIPESAQDTETAAADAKAEEPWRLSVKTVHLVDGTIAFLDERTKPSFYGVVNQISIVAGNATWPPVAEPVTLAVRGEFTGHGGHMAPMYCSGWLNPIARNLDTSCQLGPLALAAFEPYYQRGKFQARVYQSRLESTSRWVAKHNELEGRIQLTIDELQEGDLSVGGSTVVDIQEVSEEEFPTLTGEIKVTGLLNDPAQWQLELVPGNETVQRLVKPLLDRGREMVRLRVGGGTIEVGISEATAAEMSDIEAASKRVEESLEILVTPSEEEVAAAITEEAPVSEDAASADAVSEAAETTAPATEPPAETAGDTLEPAAPSSDAVPAASEEAPDESE